LISAEGMGEAHAAVVALRVALADNALDDPADESKRPWQELAAALQRVNSELRPAADYVGMGLVLPDLITDLHVSCRSRASSPLSSAPDSPVPPGADSRSSASIQFRNVAGLISSSSPTCLRAASLDSP
jgi:hypothetical protein